MHPHLDRTIKLHTNHPEQQRPCTQQWLWSVGGGGGRGGGMKSNTHLAGPNQFIDNHLHNWNLFSFSPHPARMTVLSLPGRNTACSHRGDQLIPHRWSGGTSKLSVMPFTCGWAGAGNAGRQVQGETARVSLLLLLPCLADSLTYPWRWPPQFEGMAIATTELAGLLPKKAVGNSWDILKAIITNLYH